MRIFWKNELGISTMTLDYMVKLISFNDEQF